MIDRLRTSRGGLATMISMFMLLVGAVASAQMPANQLPPEMDESASFRS